jgi:hypothetical protein
MAEFTGDLKSHEDKDCSTIMQGTEADKAADFANYFCSYAYLYHQKQMVSSTVALNHLMCSRTFQLTDCLICVVLCVVDGPCAHACVPLGHHEQQGLVQG